MGLEIGEEFTSCCRTLHNNQGKLAETGGSRLLSWHWQPGTAKELGLEKGCRGFLPLATLGMGSSMVQPELASGPAQIQALVQILLEGKTGDNAHVVI